MIGGRLILLADPMALQPTKKHLNKSGPQPLQEEAFRECVVLRRLLAVLSQPRTELGLGILKRACNGLGHSIQAEHSP